MKLTGPRRNKLIDAYYKAPYALTKKYIDVDAEELVQCDLCRKRKPVDGMRWCNLQGLHSNKALLCTPCYEREMKR